MGLEVTSFPVRKYANQIRQPALSIHCKQIWTYYIEISSTGLFHLMKNATNCAVGPRDLWETLR